MRIAVSGAHATGKTTLIGDYLDERSGVEHVPDPFELVEHAASAPGFEEFAQQLLVSARTLSASTPGAARIIERTPLDFVAYLNALHDLGRTAHPAPDELVAVAEDALAHLDLWVVLPIEHRDPTAPGPDEDLPLRRAMNDALLELVDAADLARHTRVIEITGSRSERLRRLLAESG
ncbi:AAA family ATPase [Microbacterium esteraromaticum]|uniref:AAA family ATPase n=1 Tax=Microbacterium esteraromaticum TaxID=57043 RepID=A0A939DYJ1_9MICO|nr:AAA family ATPase [Microbacterium esteraromaticum]MBN7794493.1 AAA family ATPase [Microbacterium esteraromaticum]MBN8206582.1 AAA family ATPase [Microbacterium esteraromaticum]MBN8416737.1 AAA family ATPase [Microbacterium esteraromaticum]